MVSRGWSQPDPGSTGAAFHCRDNGRAKARGRRRRRLRWCCNGLSDRSPQSVTAAEHPARRHPTEVPVGTVRLEPTPFRIDRSIASRPRTDAWVAIVAASLADYAAGQTTEAFASWDPAIT